VSGAALPLTIKGIDINLPVFSLTAVPSERLNLGIHQWQAEDIEVKLNGKPVGRADEGFWRLKAPSAPGTYELLIQDSQRQLATRLNLFVMQPYGSMLNNEINGYRIDPYPRPREGHETRYLVPRGFIEVTEQNKQVMVSPHFSLQQFLCKQEAGWPRYLLLNERMLALLEQLVLALQEAGVPVASLSVISGYRTPYYNRRIGNVANSRHVYGDAFDWYVDVDGDGRMDDLNGDGKFDGDDSRWLYAFVDEFLALPRNYMFVGGLGRYSPTRHHGGFVHVDTRGFRARW
jgi:hypothetical protein